MNRTRPATHLCTRCRRGRPPGGTARRPWSAAPSWPLQRPWRRPQPQQRTRPPWPQRPPAGPRQSPRPPPTALRRQWLPMAPRRSRTQKLGRRQPSEQMPRCPRQRPWQPTPLRAPTPARSCQPRPAAPPARRWRPRPSRPLPTTPRTTPASHAKQHARSNARVHAKSRLPYNACSAHCSRSAPQSSQARGRGRAGGRGAAPRAALTWTAPALPPSDDSSATRVLPTNPRATAAQA
jgi:hypothetical protein